MQALPFGGAALLATGFILPTAAIVPVLAVGAPFAVATTNSLGTAEPPSSSTRTGPRNEFGSSTSTRPKSNTDFANAFIAESLAAHKANASFQPSPIGLARNNPVPAILMSSSASGRVAPEDEEKSSLSRAADNSGYGSSSGKGAKASDDQGLYGKKWVCASWGPLGNAETVLKLIGWLAAVVAAIIAGAQHDTDPGKVDAYRKAAASIGVVLGFLVLLGIPDRFKLKDIGAMILIFVNNAGHWAIVLGLFLHSHYSSIGVYLFCGFVGAGDLVKIVFFIRELGVSFHPPAPVPVMYGGVIFFIVAYVAIAVLLIISDKI